MIKIVIMYVVQHELTQSAREGMEKGAGLPVENTFICHYGNYRGPRRKANRILIQEPSFAEI